jgi:hypothetical protein
MLDNPFTHGTPDICGLARRASRGPLPLHADQRFMAQSGGGLLRHSRQADPWGIPSAPSEIISTRSCGRGTRIQRPSSGPSPQPQSSAHTAGCLIASRLQCTSCARRSRYPATVTKGGAPSRQGSERQRRRRGSENESRQPRRKNVDLRQLRVSVSSLQRVHVQGAWEEQRARALGEPLSTEIASSADPRTREDVRRACFSYPPM